MSTHHEWESPRTFYSSRQERFDGPSSLQKTLTTVALLSIGYWIINSFDAWPATIKRRAYEITIYLIPSQAIYALQAIMARFSRLSHEDLRFRRADFGNQHAKAEALRHMLGHSPFPQAIRKVRSMSGVDNILPTSQELGPPGLGNWDNSCYQNSILQGMASLPEFQKYIDTSLEMCDSIVAPAPTHRALRQFLDRLSDTTSRKEVLWTPNVLKSMDSWQQQDAQEYFTRILDTIEKEASKYGPALQKRASPGLEAISDISSKEEEATHLLEKISLNDRGASPIPSQPGTNEERSPDSMATPHSRSVTPRIHRCPVDGMLAQALECQACGFSEGYSLTQFNCLTLNLGLRTHSHLQNLLDDYTEPEMVEGVECTECTKAASDKAERRESGQNSEAEDQPSPSKRPKLKPVLRTKAKQITLGRLPKDLVIHINRSIFDDYGNQRKNTSLIQYPARLAIHSRWCAPLDDDEGDAVVAEYELKCAVTHYGRHENGHYVAFGKRGKEWYCFNDEIVQKMPQEEVLDRGNVFMLFYEAVDEPLKGRDADKTAKAAKRLEAQTSSSGGSSSEGEPMEPTRPVTPVPRIPVMRTASGTLQPQQSPLEQSPVVSAL